MMLFAIPKAERKLTREEVLVHRCVFWHSEHMLHSRDIAVFTRLSIETVEAAVRELRVRRLLPRQYYSN
jgi:hypothetical protein